MGLFDKKTKETTSSTQSGTQTTDLPDYVTKGSELAVGLASNKAMEPFNAYKDPMVADFSGDSQTSFQALRDMLAKASTSTAADTAKAGASGYAAAPAQRVNTVRGVDGLEANMEPYKAAMADSMRVIQEAGDAARKRYTAAATNSGARGIGSDAAFDRLLGQNDLNTSRAMGETSNKFILDAYRNAIANGQTDAGRDVAVQGQNAGFNEEALRRLMTGSAAGVGIEGQGQQQMLQAIQSLLSGGQMQTSQEQAQFDAAYKEFLRGEGMDAANIDILVKALKTPTEGTVSTTGQGTSTKTTPDNSLLKLLGGAAGAFVGGPMGASVGASLFGGGGSGSSSLPAWALDSDT